LPRSSTSPPTTSSSTAPPRRPFGDPRDDLTEKITLASRLSPADKAAIAHIIDGLLANSRIRAALDKAR
jgi:hypothetical protein